MIASNSLFFLLKLTITLYWTIIHLHFKLLTLETPLLLNNLFTENLTVLII